MGDPEDDPPLHMVVSFWCKSSEVKAYANGLFDRVNPSASVNRSLLSVNAHLQ